MRACPLTDPVVRGGPESEISSRSRVPLLPVPQKQIQIHDIHGDLTGIYMEAKPISVFINHQ